MPGWEALGERTGLESRWVFCGRSEGVMHAPWKIGRLLAWLGVCDKSEISVCRRCWPAEAGSMRPRKCASGRISLVAQAISGVYLSRAVFCVQCCAVLCRVVLRCFFWPVLGEWSVSEHR